MQIGFALYLIMFIFLPHNIQLSEITVSNWLQIGYLGIFTSGIGYALWYSVLKKMDASRISVFNNLQPLLTTILAMIFFNQVLTLHFILGGILILIGVYVTQKK
jgi:drug/metabolite transporter (DMT)-like permease